MNTGAISMDMEDVKASYYDIMRMAGEIVISSHGTQIFKKRVDDRAVPGISEDCWKQTPGRLCSATVCHGLQLYLFHTREIETETI